MEAVISANSITVRTMDRLPARRIPVSAATASRKKGTAAFMARLPALRYTYCAAYAPVRFTMGRTVVTSTERDGEVRKVLLMKVGTHVATPSFSIPWTSTGNMAASRPERNKREENGMALVFGGVGSEASEVFVSSVPCSRLYRSIRPKPKNQTAAIRPRQRAAAPNTAFQPASHMTAAANR